MEKKKLNDISGFVTGLTFSLSHTKFFIIISTQKIKELIHWKSTQKTENQVKKKVIDFKNRKVDWKNDLKPIVFESTIRTRLTSDRFFILTLFYHWLEVFFSSFTPKMLPKSVKLISSIHVFGTLEKIIKSGFLTLSLFFTLVIKNFHSDCNCLSKYAWSLWSYVKSLLL